MRHSKTLTSVQTPIIPTVGAWLKNTPGALSLGQGMVAYAPPISALQAIQNFGAQPEHHLYGPASGYAPLLEQITQKLSRENHLDLNQGYQLMVTAGSNMAFLNVLLAITDPGDEIILPVPYYFNQEMAIRMRNCIPVSVETDAQYHLQLDAIETAITDKTRAIVTISPNNPSGAVYSEASLRAVNQLCLKYGLYHISDEAYEYFTYDDAKHFSPGSLPGASTHTISLYSLSKAYGFASWRIGYMVFPEALLPELLKIQDTNLICPPLITQYAALGALETGSIYCQQQLPDLAIKRQRLLAAFKDLTDYCEISPAEGAFYLLIKLNTARTSLEVVQNLIEQFKIAVIPGSAFGLHDGCYLRISYGMLNEADLHDALNRLRAGIKANC